MSTGSPSRLSTPSFHGYDAEQTAEYRSLSVLAIVSLVFGLASPLCFAGPLLLAIPIFGLAISLVALRRIAASEGELAGRWAALCGLVLCAIFLAAPAARDALLHSMRARQAEQFGKNWLTLLSSGHADEAFRLTTTGARPPTPRPGDPPPTISPYDAFVAQPPVKAVGAAGTGADVRLTETIDYQRVTAMSAAVRQQFQVVPSADAGNKAAVDVVLSMRRGQLPGEGRSRWLVSSIEPPGADTTANP